MGNGIHKKKKKKKKEETAFYIWKKKCNIWVKKADMKVYSWPVDPICTIPTTHTTWLPQQSFCEVDG